MNPPVLSNRFDILASALLIVVIVLATGGLGLYVLSDPGLGDAVAMIRAAELIEDEWMGEVDRGQLVESALGGMFSRLDPYSGYVRTSDFDRMREELSGAYGGIGVSVVRQADGLLVMSVRESGPAGRVGLQTGDIIIAADSVPFAGLSTTEASNLLRGEAGTTVLALIFHPIIGDTTEVELARERIPLVHVAYSGLTANEVMYVRLLDFDAGASEDVHQAVDSMLEASENKPAGLILDLRGNPGGLFSEAYLTSSLFLPRGTFIVGTDGRSRWNEETHTAMYGDITDGVPMAVIVDGGSASAAEIVAGSLQQSGRAFLVGDTTFGKGLVQGFVSFPDGNGLRLTISRYYFEHGVYLNTFDSTLNPVGQGLAPDHLYAYPEYDPFVWSLENSLLLQAFANQHSVELIGATAAGERLTIVDAFRRFTRDHDFAFRSPIIEAADEIVRRTENGAASPRTQAMARRLADASRDADGHTFAEHTDYIIRRLRQIAYEREYGTVRAYRDVIVPERGDIQLAETLLLQERP